MIEDTLEETPEIEPEPEIISEVKPIKTKCPKGFPEETWNRWNESARKNYIFIIEQSNRISGGNK